MGKSGVESGEEWRVEWGGVESGSGVGSGVGRSVRVDWRIKGRSEVDERSGIVMYLPTFWHVTFLPHL